MHRIRIPFSRRRRRSRVHVELAVLLGLLSVLALHSISSGPAQATGAVLTSTTAAASENPPRVIDGDTLQLNGVVYRIANIDTPETGSRAQCESERARAAAASAYARALVAAASSIAPQPERFDRYGRVVALVSLDGQDFGEAMIAAGHARPWRGRREPWCPSGN